MPVLTKPSELMMSTSSWSTAMVDALFSLPFFDLLFKAHTVHRTQFPANQIQISQLLSIKTGACPEDCSYCSQSGHYDTGLEKEKLLAVDEVLAQAKAAKASGASRFCMGAAWRSPPAKQIPVLVDMIRVVKALGLETCMTLGLLDEVQAEALADAGLDYYNHNLDTSKAHYGNLITTRTYDDRLTTLERVRAAGIKVCCGGIIGVGESRQDRVALLTTLANLPAPPESVPINQLVKIPGTPLANVADVDVFEFVRTIAVARILMPSSWVRLSAGRETMSDELQAWCFFAGANSIFNGSKLLTTPNPENDEDAQLLARLGLVAMLQSPADDTSVTSNVSTNEHPPLCAIPA
jgi:biotin synthase